MFDAFSRSCTLPFFPSSCLVVLSTAITLVDLLPFVPERNNCFTGGEWQVYQLRTIVLEAIAHRS
jgi:hypothetical protein